MHLSRRQFLQAATISALSFSNKVIHADIRNTNRGQVIGFNLIEARDAMQRGDMLAEDYMRQLLDEARRWQAYNALSHYDPELALEAARQADQRRVRNKVLGPLHGIPLVIKDNIETLHFPTSAGTRALASFKPNRNAPLMQHLFDAGAVLMGKTVMAEMAIGTTSNNFFSGAVHNPYRHGYIPGGSSGGTAAAVAAYIAPGGLGSDTLGSVRIPSAMCGLVGLRPTIGRYPADGVVPLSSMHDTVGPMTRTVADTALLDSVITGDRRSLSPVKLRGLRLGVPRHFFWENLEPDIASATEEILKRLKDAGVVLIEISLTDVLELAEKIDFSVLAFEAKRDLSRYLREAGTGIGFEELVKGVATPAAKGFLSRLLEPDAVDAGLYHAKVDKYCPLLRQAYARHFKTNGIAALIYPTTALPARPINVNDNVEYLGKMVNPRAYLRNIKPASNAGLPSLNLPVAMTKDRLPVGVELTGPFGQDRALLGIAAAIEQIIEPLPLPPAPVV